MNIYEELKDCLRIRRTSISDLGKSQIPPVTHSAIIQVAQGKKKSNRLRTSIEAFIAETKRMFPPLFELKD